MAITLSSLRTSVRQRADMENSQFVTDTELDSYINNSYKELYDIVVSRFEDYYSTQLLFTVSTGNTQALPTDFYKLRGIDELLGGVDNYLPLTKWIFGERGTVNRITGLGLTGYLRPQYRVMGGNIEFLPETIATGDYRLWYIPLCQDMVVGVAGTATIQDLLYTAASVYTDGNLISITYTGGATAGAEVVTVVGNAISVQIQSGVSTATQVLTAIEASVDATALVTVSISGTAATAQVTQAATFLTGSVIQVDGDDFNGWSEYVIIDAAIKCLIKEESDVQVLLMQKKQVLDRIEAMAANRDAGEPERVTDVYAGYRDWPWGFDGY